MADNTIQQHVVKIRITGIGELQTYTSLSIQQTLADVCNGSFYYREEGKTTLQHQIDFYKQLMGQELEIGVHDEHSFKGYITTVSLENEDSDASEYKIEFSGLFGKLAYHKECNSWKEKTLNGIIKEIAGNAPIDTDNKDTGTLNYAVQYNQTTFDYIKMMAARHGKWMYYEGERMSMKPPAGQPIVFRKAESIFNISIMAKNAKGHEQITGFDINTGKNISVTAPATQYDGMLAATANGAQTAYGNHETGLYVASIRDEAHGKEFAQLQNDSASASSVVFQAVTYNAKVKLGSIIQIDETDGTTGKTYIVTQLFQSSANPDNYVNYLTFIPGDVTVPPYTNPDIKTTSSPQPAIVKENDDDSGKDRLKVHFPWMKAQEMTDWVSMVTPYAGKKKGMRFLPEKDEEVLVDFIGGNIEKPYIVGAIFTDANKSDVPPGGNHIKSIGTGSGRRFEINDDAGTMKMYDNFNTQTPKNAILMKRKDDETQILIESQKDADNYAVISLTNEEFLGLGLVSGGTLIAEIRLEKDGKKITIKSDTTIDFTSGTINMHAENINIKATKELKMEGTKGGQLKSKDFNIDTGSNISIKGSNIIIEAAGTLDLKAGGEATLVGSPVKIN